MVNLIESRVYPLPSVSKPTSDRLSTTNGTYSDSVQRSAQSFIDSLPSDIRDRVNPQYRQNQRKTGFEDTQEPRTEETATSDDLQSTSRLETQARPERTRSYSAPQLTSSSALFQIQLSFQEANQSYEPLLTKREFEQSHAAYLNAGAQPGGKAQALAAQIAREEQTHKTLIVPPVLTAYNAFA